MARAQYEARAGQTPLPIAARSAAQIATTPATKTADPPQPTKAPSRHMKDGLRARQKQSSHADPKRSAAHLNPARDALRTSERITPESSTATRPGRQFTVGNVGNNGLMYLRPVSRPSNFRSPPPSPFTTVPRGPVSTTQSIDAVKCQRRASSVVPESTFSNSVEQARTQQRIPPRIEESSRLPAQKTPPRPHLSVRPRSYSTIHETAPRSSTEDPGTFRVVIQHSSRGTKRPITPRRPSQPTLEVPIPHFRLGDPQFGPHGSATLRSSVYTRSSHRQEAGLAHAGKLSSILHSSYLSAPAPSPGAFPPPPRFFKDTPSLQLPPQLSPGDGAWDVDVLSAPDLSIFDNFISMPDDPATVRYSPVSHQITAATPARLVAHITSPNFLDYDLLSDFFLTFRAFVRADVLVSFLIMRLRWAMDKMDDGGRITRVRTFVALRHWILNYFLDDYIPDPSLRSHFCASVNGLCVYLQDRGKSGTGDLKIVGELKKCWRRTCALYWEDRQGDSFDPIHDQILPGGNGQLTDPAVIDRNPGLSIENPIGLENTTAEEMPRHQRLGKQSRNKQSRNKQSKQSLHGPRDFSSAAFRTESSAEASDRSTPALYRSQGLFEDTPPQSDGAVEAASPSQAVQSATLGIALSTRTINTTMTGVKRRHGSFSDALREEGPATPVDGKGSTVNVPTMLVVPGCLIRGALYQPASPFLDVKTAERLTAYSKSQDCEIALPLANKQTITQNPGVRRLFGSVRKALSHRQLQDTPTSPTFSGQAVTAVTTLPATVESVGPLSKPPATRRHRNQVRVDLLAARVQESFKEAVSKLDEYRKILSSSGLPEDTERHSSVQLPREEAHTWRAVSSTDVRSLTIGSRSIVIVDDTGDEPLMSGALGPPVPSVRAIAAIQSPSTGVIQGLWTSQSSLTEMEKTSNLFEGSGDRHLRQLSVQQPQVYIPSGYRKSSVAEIDRLKTPVSGIDGLRASLTSNGSARSGRQRFATYHSGVTPSPRATGLQYLANPSSEVDPLEFDRPPPRQLRRRPGGDLRAVDDTGGLKPRAPVNSESDFGSIAASPPKQLSHQSAMADRVVGYDSSHRVRLAREDTHSTAASTIQKSISLIQSHSSQQNLRPSFEAEVKKLAALPDDDDDGGIESALAKLEGTYEKKSSRGVSLEGELGLSDLALLTADKSGEQKEKRHHEHVADLHSPEHIGDPEVQDEAIDLPSSRKVPSETFRISSQKVESPIPDPQQIDPQFEANAQPLTQLHGLERSLKLRSGHSTRTDVSAPGRNQLCTDRVMSPHGSFLLDDNQQLSDPSEADPSECEDPPGYQEGAPNDADSASSEEDDPKTPTAPVHRLAHGPLDGNPTLFGQQLSTPRTSPNIGPLGFAQSTGSTDDLPKEGRPNFASSRSEQPGTPVPSRPGAHLPFVLAYDADVLARQFTLVEKDALDEIDWRELVDTTWRQTTPSVTDWVQYLLSQQASTERSFVALAPKFDHLSGTRRMNEDQQIPTHGGVDLVIARFNLVVRWCQSEILLCDTSTERARCISQMIQIAWECRRISNYATMYQLTVSLLSSDISRLKATWSIVHDNDKQILSELEKVASPLKGFHNLRSEMEAAGMGDDGCVPFVGMYTRSLLQNAQKPATIPVSASGNSQGEPLVNFERFQSAAIIVKSLLRLLEASNHYRFRAEPVVLSRCLWLASLTASEIAERSKRLEKGENDNIENRDQEATVGTMAYSLPTESQDGAPEKGGFYF